MILKDIIDIIEFVAPLGQQEMWDNSGLQVGDPGADIQAALLTIDITEDVVKEAIVRGCNLIVSHHPLLYHGLKHLTGSTPQERCVAMALAHHTAIYSAHTTIDNYLHGVSGRMAEKLGITNYRILVPHSDEEVVGLGVIGELPNEMTQETFLKHVQQTFSATYLRYTHARNPNKVRIVAMCGGAGAEFAETAIAQGADAYISADFKYHELQSLDERIMAIDIDHWVSEHFTRDIFAELLSQKIPTHISQVDHSPIEIMAYATPNTK